MRAGPPAAEHSGVVVVGLRPGCDQRREGVCPADFAVAWALASEANALAVLWDGAAALSVPRGALYTFVRLHLFGQMPTTKDFKLEELSKYFHLPEKAVAKQLGICLTSLKKLCRSYGITRWPFRKLKSIQRTLAKVQDETNHPSVSAQFVAAGLALPGNEAAAAAFKASQAAEAGAAESENMTQAAAQGAGAGGAAGGHANVAAQDGAKTIPPLPVVPVDGHTPNPSASGRGGIVRKRKMFQIGGRSVMMTEEEKSIYELTIGKTGVLVPPTESEQSNKGGGANKEKPAASRESTRADNPSRALHAGSHNNSGSATPKDRQFRCNAAGKNLEITNWATLWTQDHLQKRLLEPLGGKSISFSSDLSMSMAYLHFENERTAQRAELICRAAAAAAEKNMRASSGSASHSASRERSPALSITPSEIPGGSPSQLDAARLPGKAPAKLGDKDNAPNKGLKLETSGAKGGVPGGAGGPSSSPVFKSTPVTPPTSDSAYLFDSQFHDNGSFGALLMPSSSMGFEFQNPDSHTSCVEVSSTSIMGAPDDMTSALMAGSSMAGMSSTQLGEILTGDVNMASPPLSAQDSQPSSKEGDPVQPGSKDGARRPAKGTPVSPLEPGSSDAKVSARVSSSPARS